MTFEEFKDMLHEAKDNNYIIMDKNFIDFNIPNNFDIGNYKFFNCSFSLTFNQTNFCNSNFINCNFANSVFNKVFLIMTTFFNCSFKEASIDFRETDTKVTIFKKCNFTGTQIKNLDISKIDWDDLTIGLAMACPEEGAFIGFKKAKYHGGQALIKLLIDKDSLRSSATTRKCRCSKATVLEIISLTNGRNLKYALSCCDKNFKYEIGKIVKAKDFNTNRWIECSTGIHFFITKQEAINYELC